MVVLLLLSALVGLVLGWVLGWVGGRGVGLLEGAHAERRRIRRDARTVSVVGVETLPAMAGRGEQL